LPRSKPGAAGRRVRVVTVFKANKKVKEAAAKEEEIRWVEGVQRERRGI
jgi:hypothetical protein